MRRKLNPAEIFLLIPVLYFIITFILYPLFSLLLNSFTSDTSSFSNWEIKNNSSDKTLISWAKFEWTNDTLSGKYFERTSMNIPCKVQGLPNTFTFQFDLGADLTGI